MKRSDRRASRDQMRTDAEARTLRAREERRKGVLGSVEALAENAFPAGDLVIDDGGGERPVSREQPREPRAG
jgi:hypothetical protein